MIVEIKRRDRSLGVPLSQLESIGVDEMTQKAIADRNYWVRLGYQLD
jgi:hypothetical protein